MINFIPVFPLNIVVYPGEALNLHIFEPRYKQLITECLTEKKSLGIPYVPQTGIVEYGTVIEVQELVATYPDGEMDVKTLGSKVFRVLESVPSIPGKLYSGAIVEYPNNDTSAPDSQIARLILSEITRLFRLLSQEDKLPKDNLPVVSYDIAHFVGLNRDEEYELLTILTEIQRLEYLRRHLHRLLPLIVELEEVKARIQRNGHFRNLSLGDLNL
jgi:Lon protease-like protein